MGSSNSGLAPGAVIALAVVVFVLVPGAVLGIMLASIVSGLGVGLAACAPAGGFGGGAGTGAAGGAAHVGERRWNADQMANARTITGVVMQRQLPQRAAVIAISTAIVESDLINVNYGDRDSLGLFQQRPSQGWGSPQQVTNPVYATNTFLDHLVDLDGWATMPPGVAQQMVQRSAFPERYAPAERPAAKLMQRFWRGPDNPVPSDGDDAARSAGTSPQAARRCPDSGGPAVPVDPQKLPPGYTLPRDPKQRAAVSYALSKLGAPYVWGAKGPHAFDCSGLMQAAWAHAGVAIGAGTYTQKTAGRAVGGIGQLQPGDLVFIPGSRGTAANPGHVGMYAGHGLIVNAYSSDKDVILQTLQSWAPKTVMIRRVSEPQIPAPPPALHAPAAAG